MKRPTIFRFSFVCALVLALVACDGDETPTPSATAVQGSPTQAAGTPPTGYPSGVTISSEAYPGVAPPTPTIEGLVTEPPDPEVILPAPEGNNGVIGGVLIREVIEAGGFVPVTPRELILGEVVRNSEGEPFYIRQNSESRRAQLLNTGIFIFSSVPPGTYGIIVDLGFTNFPLLNPEGETWLITVEPKQSIMLGQVFIDVPDS